MAAVVRRLCSFISFLRESVDLLSLTLCYKKERVNELADTAVPEFFTGSSELLPSLAKAVTDHFRPYLLTAYSIQRTLSLRPSSPS